MEKQYRILKANSLRKLSRVVCIGLFAVTTFAWGSVTPLQALYQRGLPTHLNARLDAISQTWVGQPYIIGPLGEGLSGAFDQCPRYRFDGFDCLTFVETVIAMALAKTPEQFTQCIDKIRYYRGKATFLTRNHITSQDWNPNNQTAGFVEDITSSIVDKAGKPVQVMAEAPIDKAAWCRHLPETAIHLQDKDPNKVHARYEALQKACNSLPKAQIVRINYIPLTTLFDANNQPNLALWEQIPDAAIVEIVRPRWDLRKQVGTYLHVSHLGFVFKRHGTWIYREASSLDGHVIDISLIDYLRDAMKNPTIKGIHVLKVRDVPC